MKWSIKELGDKISSCYVFYESLMLGFGSDWDV